MRDRVQITERRGVREHNSAVHASANTEEELGPEPDAETAAKYYGGQVKSLRFRCRAAR